MKKKKTPLIVLRETQELLDSIREVVGKKNPLVKILENQEGALVYIEDIDSESDFYFKVIDAQIDEVVENNKTVRKIIFEYEHCPVDATSIDNWNGKDKLEEIVKWVKNWIGYLKEYNEIQLFQDVFVDKYAEKFYSEFEILDENADNEPFNLEQQLFLNEYFDIIEKALEESKEEYDVIEIQDDVKELRQNLTQLPKNSVLKKLSRIWAKAQKKGLKLLNEIYTSFKKEVIKRVTTEGIETIEQIGETIKQLMSG